MKRRSIASNVVSLFIGGFIGLAIALPIRYPAVKDSIAQAWTNIQACKTQIQLDYELELNWELIALPESNADHGETLAEVMCGISTEEYEHVAVFYGTRKLFEVTSFDPGQVKTDYSWPNSMAPNMTELHNHPLLDYSFSYVDLNELCRYCSFGTSIVVTADMVYTLSAPDGWPTQSELKTFFNDHFGINLASDHPEITPTLLADLQRKGYLIVTREGNTISIGLTSKTVAEYADYFDLIYTVEPLSGESGSTLGEIIWSE